MRVWKSIFNGVAYGANAVKDKIGPFLNFYPDVMAYGFTRSNTVWMVQKDVFPIKQICRPGCQLLNLFLKQIKYKMCYDY